MCLSWETQEYKSALGALGACGIDRMPPAGRAPCLLLRGDAAGLVETQFKTLK